MPVSSSRRKPREELFAAVTDVTFVVLLYVVQFFFLSKLNKPREELLAEVTDVTFVVLPAWLHADPMPALVVNC